uniref:Uncharacterized protein n=1 Tax=Sphaerodactylus townsendi TaxID=933632 RepID=A0ACB8G086_9SAUR
MDLQDWLGNIQKSWPHIYKALVKAKETYKFQANKKYQDVCFELHEKRLPLTCGIHKWESFSPLYTSWTLEGTTPACNVSFSETFS